MPTVKGDGHATASIDELPSLYDGLIKLARTELARTAVGLRGEGAVVIRDAPEWTSE
jgi:hypothetical protein